MKMTREGSDLLKSYVYVYTDPRTKRPFYIGKGRGNRLFAHLNDTSETKTVDRIAAIRKSGKEPQIDLLCYGLTDGG
ncbi:MAG TPA: GIY-YIG nuclease family protein, partial [Kiritimatiellia bacterium]|nr:GIY-YIG nuclease family protein [Kiritimatiellia bacterium]